MSHFTVLCIGDNIDEQLEPYWELDLSQDEAKYDNRATFQVEYSKEEFLKEMKEYNNKSPENFAENVDEYAEYSGLCEQNGNYGYFSNPNAKWDWYSVGGRWSGTFKIKDNPKYPSNIQNGELGLMSRPAPKGYCDSIRICDVDFEGMKKDAVITYNKYWKEAFEKYADDPAMLNLIYDIPENITKEEYINKNLQFSSHAVLKDGEWYEKGKMDWFGLYSDENENWNEKFGELLKSLPEDTLLTMVDCHI